MYFGRILLKSQSFAEMLLFLLNHVEILARIEQDLASFSACFADCKRQDPQSLPKLPSFSPAFPSTG